jgi:hypothetical protein
MVIMSISLYIKIQVLNIKSINLINDLPCKIIIHFKTLSKYITKSHFMTIKVMHGKHVMAYENARVGTLSYMACYSNILNIT